MTRRDEDELVEDLCAARIDAWMAARGWTYERTTAREEQVAGIDAWLTVNGRRLAVDEKAKHRDLQTKNWFRIDPDRVSFEVDRVVKGGARRTGWFCDPGCRTKLYLFAFPAWRYQFDKSCGIMERMKFWLLPKAGVEKLAAQHGFEKDTLVARARSMLDSGTTRIQQGPLSLYMSVRYDERPVNLVVPTPLLRGVKGFQEFYA